MSSSTFSFKAELKVITLVLAALAAAEGATALFATRFSADLRQIGELDAKLQQGVATKDLSVVVLGNSLTLRGFDQPVVQAASVRFTPPAKCTFVVFQGAFMPEMYRIYMHYVDRLAPPPKIIVMPFCSDGLTDQSGIEIERMVYHCDWTELRDVIKDEVGLGQLGEFLHNYFSRAFANRSRVRQFVFEHILPDYRESEARIRSANRPVAAAASGTERATYILFERMLDRCRRKGIRVVLLAMPIRGSYPIRPEVSALVAKYKMDLLDMRATPGLDDAKFSDGVHLNKAGAAVFTDAFLNRFAQFLGEQYPHSEKSAAR